MIVEVRVRRKDGKLVLSQSMPPDHHFSWQSALGCSIIADGFVFDGFNFTPLVRRMDSPDSDPLPTVYQIQDGLLACLNENENAPASVVIMWEKSLKTDPDLSTHAAYSDWLETNGCHTRAAQVRRELLRLQMLCKPISPEAQARLQEAAEDMVKFAEGMR